MNQKNQPRIRNFGACGHDDYDPRYPIKIFPIGSFGGGHSLRDKNGANIGGGSIYNVRDSHGNYYSLLITKAVYDDLIKSLRPPLSRTIPGNLFVEVELMDFPQEAITRFEIELFQVYFDEEEQEFYPPIFKKHEWHRLKPKIYILALKEKGKFRHITSILDMLIDEYKGQSTQEHLHIDAGPYARLTYIFTFPEPWIVNRVFSPTYWYQGWYHTRNDGFEYAWYYGRYGIFEDWGQTTDYPHKYEHSVRGWDIGIKRGD